MNRVRTFRSRRSRWNQVAAMALGPWLVLLASSAGAEVADPSGLPWPAADLSVDCDVTPLQMEFGPTPLQESETQYFRVINHGAQPLQLFPETDEEVFTVQAGPLDVAPGDTVYSWITFRPVVGDTFRTEVGLGPEICSSISCLGVLAGQTGTTENIVGITFDPVSLEAGYFEAVTTAWPLSLVTAYLALLNPVGGDGLGGWECCVGLTGNAMFTGWDLEGFAVNVLPEPCFMVGLGEPLPPASYHILARTSILVYDAEESIKLTLNPVYHASIPDQMAWLTGDENGQLVPMTTQYGYSEVAYIEPHPLSGAGDPVPARATRLLPNVPNPFNPRTEIRFELEQGGVALVTVYDLTGRRVRALGNQYLASGSHSYIWDGTDEAGRRVASGAYTVRLETGDHVDRRTVMLLK